MYMYETRYFFKLGYNTCVSMPLSEVLETRMASVSLSGLVKGER